MQLELICPHCAGRVVWEDLSSDRSCSRCDVLIELPDAAGAQPSVPLSRCAVCGSAALFTQKDFNRKLGLALVAASAVVMFWSFFWGLATLVALALVDWWLYRVLPSVTVCYACKSVYRGWPLNPDHGGYELRIDEAFEGTGQPLKYAPPSSDSRASRLGGPRR